MWADAQVPEGYIGPAKSVQPRVVAGLIGLAVVVSIAYAVATSRAMAEWWLLHRLRSTAPAERMPIVLELEKLKSVEAIPYLLESLGKFERHFVDPEVNIDEQEAELGEYALIYVRRLGQITMQALLRTLKQEDRCVQAAACKALIEVVVEWEDDSGEMVLPPSASGFILELSAILEAKGTSPCLPVAKMHAADALGWMGPGASVAAPILRKLSADDEAEPDVGEAGRDALRDIEVGGAVEEP